MVIIAFNSYFEMVVNKTWPHVCKYTVICFCRPSHGHSIHASISSAQSDLGLLGPNPAVNTDMYHFKYM